MEEKNLTKSQSGQNLWDRCDHESHGIYMYIFCSLMNRRESEEEDPSRGWNL